MDTAERNSRLRIGIFAGKTRLINHVQAVETDNGNMNQTMIIMTTRFHIANMLQIMNGEIAHFYGCPSIGWTGLISGNLTLL